MVIPKQSRLNLINIVTSISQILDATDYNSNDLDVTKLRDFVNAKVPDPFITTDQALSYIRVLDPSKATGVDGLGPKIIKLAANSISNFIAKLMNKSKFGNIPRQLKYTQKYFLSSKVVQNQIPLITTRFQYFLQLQKYLKNV